MLTSRSPSREASMLTFTLTNRRCLVKEKLQTIMKQVLYTYFLASSKRLKETTIGTRSAICGGTTTVVRPDLGAVSS